MNSRAKQLNINQPYLGTAEVAFFLGITKQRLTNWWKRNTFSFPSPIIVLRMGPIWKREKIVEWKEKHTCKSTGELLPPSDLRSKKRVKNMKKDTTLRGFTIIEFKDRYGIDCSLQMSSLATENCIWLGCNKADPQVLVPGEGWKPIEMPTEYIANNRMHLTQQMVKDLLPHLQKFAETGEL